MSECLTFTVNDLLENGFPTWAVFSLLGLLLIWLLLRLRAARLATGGAPIASDPFARARRALSLTGLLEQFRGVQSNEKVLQQLEETLVTSDFGIRTVEALLATIREKNLRSPDELMQQIRASLAERVQSKPPPKAPRRVDEGNPPLVIMVAGVNGVGKTTTIGKLAYYYSSQGAQVSVVAADTFRFAAVDQLKRWAERAGADFFGGAESASPSGVTFDGLERAKARGTQVIIVDSAGRLHTNKNLMDELLKMKRVMAKVVPDAPHEVWLVIDSTLGQNSFQQAKQFHQQLGLSGVVLTKMDGTSRGGVAVSICDEFDLPIVFLGVGEAMEALVPFNVDAYLSGILAPAPS